MNSIKALDRLAGDSSSITITVHIHPDGDAIGSGTALMSYLTECRGKDAVLVVPGIVPESIAVITENVPEGRILEYGLDPEGACRRIRESDLLFCLDCNSYSRTTPEMEGLLRASSAKKVLIDHHLNPETESYSLVFSETEISSTCELLYTILKRMPDIGGRWRTCL